MGSIPTVTCQRCGKEFSALRADCPFCGKRRTIGDTKKETVRRESAAPRPKPERQQTQTRQRRISWQTVAGLLLIAGAILAIVLMVLIGKAGKPGILARPTPTPEPVATLAPRPSPTPTPTPTVEQIKIFFLTREITAAEGGFTMYVGDAPLTISARAYPNDKLYDAPFQWRVSDPSKAQLSPSEDTQSCEVTVLASAGGYITLTVSCYGMETSVPLYIWER